MFYLAAGVSYLVRAYSGIADKYDFVVAGKSINQRHGIYYV